MTSERVRGIILYLCAGLVLAGGGLWWLHAAPKAGIDPQLAQWRQAAEQALPDDSNQQSANTEILAAGVDRVFSIDAGTGSYLISVVCVGADGSELRINLGDPSDSGHGLNCVKGQPPYNFNVGISGSLDLHVTVAHTGPVILRYTVLPSQ